MEVSSPEQFEEMDSDDLVEDVEDMDSDHLENMKSIREEDSLQDRSFFRGKPYEDLTFPDLHDVEFKTAADVDRFYSYYSLANGFSIRKHKLDWNRSGTHVIRRVLVCAKEGSRKESGEDASTENGVNENPLETVGGKDAGRKFKKNKRHIGQSNGGKQCKKTRRVSRSNCPASFTVSWCSIRKVFYAKQFMTDHNHDLATVDQRQFLPSHRHVSNHDLAQVIELKKASVPTFRAYEILSRQAGGYPYVGFTLRDLYNRLGSEKKDLLVDGDAQASIAWMNMNAIRDPEFYCVFNVDENGRLANMFWRDGQSFSDYTKFGDVLLFDSTYKTNIYGKLMTVFVGTNNHRATVLFGCALLADETEGTYAWVLNSFLISMRGKKPISVITDGDDAMRNALVNVVPEARHRLCAWHIGKNVCAHLKDEEMRR